MSHNFKAPSRIDPQERRDERLIKLMARAVRSQEALNALLEGSTPQMRAAMLERITPHLGFVPTVD